MEIIRVPSNTRGVEYFNAFKLNEDVCRATIT